MVPPLPVERHDSPVEIGPPDDRKSDLKRIFLFIDLHIVLTELLVSMLVVGIVASITFVPGIPPLIPSMLIGFIPLFVFVEPVIITRTLNRMRIRGDAKAYFAMNTLIAALYGIICSLLIYTILPRASQSASVEAEQATTQLPVPIPPIR